MILRVDCSILCRKKDVLIVSCGGVSATYHSQISIVEQLNHIILSVVEVVQQSSQ